MILEKVISTVYLTLVEPQFFFIEISFRKMWSEEHLLSFFPLCPIMKKLMLSSDIFE